MADNERIDELLNQAADPVQRAIVVVLGSINRDLQAQTAATNALAVGVDQSNKSSAALDQKISKHMVDEEVMMAGFKGSARFGLWVAPILFSALSILGSYIWMTQSTTLRDIEVTVTTTRQRQLVNEERILGLERRQNTDELIRQVPPQVMPQPLPPERAVR